MDFEAKFKEINNLISLVKEHTAGMDKASFLSAIGTVMKIYSLENDLPMKDFMIEFVAGIFTAEDAFSGLFGDDE